MNAKDLLGKSLAAIVGWSVATAWQGAAAVGAGTADASVELPLFEVVDTPELPPPEVWLYATVPGFEVLSSLSEEKTTRFLQDFMLLRSAIDVIMPGAQDAAEGEPAALILCGRGGDFFRFVPAERGADMFRIESLFFDERGRRAIVVNNALSRVEIDPAGVQAGVPSVGDADDEGEAPESDVDVGDLAQGTLEADPYRAFYAAYFRQIIRWRSGSATPAWFEEGMVELLAAIDFSQRTVTLGRVGDGLGSPRSGDFNRILAGRTLMPMEEFFVHRPAQADRVWSAQCYAFVHMCLYGRGKRYQKGFGQLVARAASAPVSEAVVEECLGLGFRELGLELRGYVDAVDHTYEQLRAGKAHSLPEPAAVVLRDASDSEGGRLVGDVLALAGRSDTARLALIAPLKRGAKDPRLDASVGLWAWRSGDLARASRYLERATSGGVDRSEAYLRLAEMRLEALGRPSVAVNLTVRDLALVIVLLEEACRRAPPRAEVFSMLAGVWLRCAEAPPSGAISLINAGVMRFPRDATLIVRAAELNLRHGDPREAREILRHGLAIVREPQARAALEEIGRKLPSLDSDSAPTPTRP